MSAQERALVDPVNHIITYDDIQVSLEKTRPNVNEQDVRKLEEWRDEFGGDD